MATMGSGASTGAIALRNCVQKSLAFSPALSETSLRVKSLHRDALRSVPWVKRAYSVPLPEREMRKLLSSAFREKATVADLHQINRLIALGRMDLEETLMLWKVPTMARRPPGPRAGCWRPFGLGPAGVGACFRAFSRPFGSRPAADLSLSLLTQGESHVMQMFDELLEKEEKAASAPPTFLDKFYDGK
eukprot:scaffold7776_cov107-Isochrysis_galbana.AAC.2